MTFANASHLSPTPFSFSDPFFIFQSDLFIDVIPRLRTARASCFARPRTSLYATAVSSDEAMVLRPLDPVGPAGSSDEGMVSRPLDTAVEPRYDNPNGTVPLFFNLHFLRTFRVVKSKARGGEKGSVTNANDYQSSPTS